MVIPEDDKELEKEVKLWLNRIPEPERQEFSSEALSVMFLVRKILESKGLLPPLR